MAVPKTNRWFVAATMVASSSVPITSLPYAVFVGLPYLRPCEVSLTGSPCSLALQNNMADALEMVRIRNEELERFKAEGVLAPLLEDEAVKISPRLAERYRWCLPATRTFVLEISRQFYDRYGIPLQINSAVRTVERQQVLMQSNRNAARGETPERRSPHLTGSTVDIAKMNLTESQRVWLGELLLRYEAQGRIEATEEFQQAVFHVMVFR